MFHELLDPFRRTGANRNDDRRGLRHFWKPAPGPRETTAGWGTTVADTGTRPSGRDRPRYSQNPADRGIWL